MTQAKEPAVQEDEIRRAAEIREWLDTRIQDLESELSHLREMTLIVDSILRKASFVPATKLRAGVAVAVSGQKSAQLSPSSSIGKIPPSALSVSSDRPQAVPRDAGGSSSFEQQQGNLVESKQLRRSKDAMLLANAFISADKVDIVPASDVNLSPVTPPFQSFFLNRILKGYEAKDQQLVESGKLRQDKVLKFETSESDGRIQKVTVTNYRENARLNEILSTATWAFTRMLEKK
jgi:hypothetical protein